MSEQTKFKVGQVWADSLGNYSIIEYIGNHDIIVRTCDYHFSATDYTFLHNLDGSCQMVSRQYDLVTLICDVVPENQATQTDIQLKIQQIEQQLQELKELLKD